MTATQSRRESHARPTSAPVAAERARTAAHPERVWLVCALVAAAAVVIAAFLPLWRMELLAPQYPAGLSLDAYGTRLTGDLPEINTLNHYVGIKAIDPDSLMELRLFPFVIGGLVLAILFGAVRARRRRSQLLLAAMVWSLPVGLLVDLQWWLYRYGHDLDPTAPFRLEPFTPKVLGTTTIVNFHAETMFAIGSWILLAAGLLLAFGPSIVRFVTESWNNTGEAKAKAAAVVAVAVGLAAAAFAQSADVAQATAEPYSVQAAIDAAEPGATVVVPPGTHHGPIVIDRPLTLEGQGAAVLDGDGIGDVVRVTAKGVTVRGFLVRNSARNVSDEPTGIRVLADGAVIEDNRLEDVLYGISLHNSNGHTVRNNDVRSVAALAPERRGHAVYLWYSTDNTITGNTLHDAKDGIFLGFAERTLIEDNVVMDLRYGLHTMYAVDLQVARNTFRENVAGASLMYSRNMIVADNEFNGSRSPASGYGLLLKDMDDVEIRDNRITENRLGLTMEGAPRTPGATVVIRDNLIAANQTAMELFSTTDATFTGNSFIGNLHQVETRGGSLASHNSWSQDGRGNYWDDYQGFDADGDGVGDLPYRYEGVYDDLMRRNEAIRAYAFTPARSALELAARWFPVYRAEPRVVDDAPLMTPEISFATSSAGAAGFGYALASLALVVGAGAIVAVGQRTIGRRWSSC